MKWTVYAKFAENTHSGLFSTETEAESYCLSLAKKHLNREYNSYTELEKHWGDKCYPIPLHQEEN